MERLDAWLRGSYYPKAERLLFRLPRFCFVERPPNGGLSITGHALRSEEQPKRGYKQWDCCVIEHSQVEEETSIYSFPQVWLLTNANNLGFPSKWRDDFQYVFS